MAITLEALKTMLCDMVCDNWAIINTASAEYAKVERSVRPFSNLRYNVSTPLEKFIEANVTVEVCNRVRTVIEVYESVLADDEKIYAELKDHIFKFFEQEKPENPIEILSDRTYRKVYAIILRAISE